MGNEEELLFLGLFLPFLLKRIIAVTRKGKTDRVKGKNFSGTIRSAKKSIHKFFYENSNARTQLDAEEMHFWLLLGFD